MTVVMLAAAFVPVLGTLTDDRDVSAETVVASSMTEANVSIFTQESRDFASLAYINDSLPETMDATEWVHAIDGFWYNINEQNSEKYGKYLTYGDVRMGADEIKGDIFSKYGSVFTSTTFQILQISYAISAPCNIGITVAKTGETTFNYVQNVDMLAAGSTMTSVKKATIFTINDTGTPDITVTNISGVYDVTVKCDGVNPITYHVQCNGQYVNIKGTVKDAGGNAITWGRPTEDYVEYSVDSSTDTNIAPIMNDGTYSIEARVGTLVEIKNVIVYGYSFTNHYFSYGTITTTNDEPVFMADETTKVINVIDSSATPNNVTGAAVSAVWYYEVKVDDKYYILDDATQLVDVVPGKVSVQYATDSNGITHLAYCKPVPSTGTVTIKTASGNLVGTLRTELYITASEPSYTFKYDTMPTPGGPMNLGLPTLLQKGNAYLVADDTTQTLAAEDLSFIVNVKGAGTTATNLSNVNVNTIWLYQTGDAAPYEITNTAPSGVTAGSVKTHGVTDADGNVLISYVSPKCPATTHCHAFLYMWATSDYYSFTFKNYNDMLGSSMSDIPTQIAGKPGCAATEDPSTFSTSLISDLEVFTVSVEIMPEAGGSLPAVTTVTYKRTGSSGTFTDIITTTDGNFKFNVKSGDASQILLSAEGYKFTYNGMDIPTIGVGLPSISSDKSYTAGEFKSAKTIVITDRANPISIGDYKIDSLKADALVKFEFGLADRIYTTTVTADSTGLAELAVFGWDGQSVQVITATSENSRIGNLVNGGTVTAIKTVTKRIATFYNSVDDTPTIANVSKNVTIDAYYGGTICSSVETGSDGLANLSVPESGVVYKYKTYEIVPIAGTGVFDGYLVFNMYGYMASAAVNTINVTIKYLSSSSFDNISIPACTKIVTTEDVTKIVKLGDSQRFTAPALEGFSFAGWYLNGDKVSSSNEYTFTAATEDGSNEVTLLAVYAASSVVEPVPGVDNSVIAIGVAAIVVALLALVYVIFQSKRF